MRHFVVLGGAGTIGKIVVHDLFESHKDNRIVIADYRESAALSLAESFNNPRVTARFLDANVLGSLIDALSGQNAVINCLQHNFNLSVMNAALISGTHYVDLGGLFSFTRKQLKLHKHFRRAGLTAVIGMGCSPGITNIQAAYAISKLGRARSIKIRVGNIDLSGNASKDLWFSYSAQTITEELTLRPWIFRNGKFQQISPRTGWELTEFPEPIGKIWTLWTRHSEIATLSFKRQGVKFCDFKVSFEPDFVEEIMRRYKTGWVLADFQKLMTSPKQPPQDYEVSRVTVDNLVVDCHAQSKPEWWASAGDINTGCPPSIVAQMIAEGAITERGVMPPEVAVPIQPFFAELKKRNMSIVETRLD